MRIAIVGGGASGLVAAYLLNKRHEVDLYERASYLGGHVRTLGQNIKVNELPPGKFTENGPLGFHAKTSPTLLKLLKQLKIPSSTVAFGTHLFLEGGSEYFLRPDLQHWRRRFIESNAGGLRTGVDLLRLLAKSRRAREKKDDRQLLGDVLPRDSFFRDWCRSLIMLGHSTPIASVNSLPAWFSLPILTEGLLHPEWVFIPGGVHSYQAAILSQFDGQIFLNASVDQVFRDNEGITLSVNGNSTARYDKLIVAAPPGRVLSMLERPTQIEASFFSSWDNEIRFRTIAHTDLSMYQNKKSARPMIADCFQRVNDDFGYNCCVSRVYSDTDEFNFAYNLDDLIDPAKRLDTHEHQIPAYSHAALQHRQDLINTNGTKDTFYVGAYMGGGLHEGAVNSAVRVARLLGECSMGVPDDLQ